MKQITTAYDKRRYLTLVDILADTNSKTAVLHLCKLWNVEPAYDPSGFVDLMVTVQTLARHVIQYHRNETLQRIDELKAQADGETTKEEPYS